MRQNWVGGKGHPSEAWTCAVSCSVRKQKWSTASEEHGQIVKQDGGNMPLNWTAKIFKEGHGSQAAARADNFNVY